jgi:hypothetical protein
VKKVAQRYSASSLIRERTSDSEAERAAEENQQNHKGIRPSRFNLIAFLIVAFVFGSRPPPAWPQFNLASFWPRSLSTKTKCLGPIRYVFFLACPQRDCILNFCASSLLARFAESSQLQLMSSDFLFPLRFVLRRAAQ